MKEIIVNHESDGQKAEKFVRKWLSEAPLSIIFKAFRKKDVKVNGHWVKREEIVHEGDAVRVYLTDEQLADFAKPRLAIKRDLDLPIVYEDRNVLIVDKPAGLLVMGDNKGSKNTLAQKVLDYLYFKDEFDPEHPTFVPSPAHRLDRNTAGLVCFGKTDAGLKALEELFKERKDIDKRYLALVKGSFERSLEISVPLKKDSQKGLVEACSIVNGGKPALTVVRPIESFIGYSLVECELLTGRTHQIRVHLAYVEHPIVGDGKYGDFETNRLFEKQFGWKGQFLRAYKLTFGRLEGILSPLSGRSFTSPLSKKEEDLLTALRNKGE